MNILSLNFLLLFFSIFIVYWSFFKTQRQQNLFLLVCSYIIYSSWSIPASFLLLGISLFSYFTGFLLNKIEEEWRKTLLFFNIVINLGTLFLFKYYDFFASELCNFIGLSSNKISLNVLLPVGISFYIFTTTGYIIDVYKHKRAAEKNIVDYLCFISFFPLIMSGPIERSTTLLPQFKNERFFNYDLVVDGCQQIIWGLFKKMVIADNCATVVNFVFPNYEAQPASALIIAAMLYSFQIYFDFSGYSDIAIGFSKMLGFNVNINFHYPYFALNISDFWRRWHMSLQRWFTDYIYFPMGGSRCSQLKTLFNTFVVFAICGIWHGANWTFIVWGIYNAVLFAPYILFLKNRTKKRIDDNVIVPCITDCIQMLITFISVTIGWIIFNSSSMTDAFGYIVKCFNLSTLFTIPGGIGLSDIYITIILIIVVLILEWLEKDKEYALQTVMPKWLKLCVLYILIYFLIFNRAGAADFIYLQF